MTALGEKLRTHWLTIFLALYAATASVSISLQQAFYAFALLTLLASWLMLRHTNIVLPKFRWRPYYWLLLLWLLWRVVHVLISDYPGKELFQAREMWLMLMLPLVADVLIPLGAKLKNGKTIRLLGLPPLEFVVLFLVVAGALVGYFNSIQFILQGGDFLGYRARALNNQNALTFSGTASLTTVIALGYLLVARRRTDNPRYLMPLLWFSLIGLVLAFILAKSRGGFIALVMTLALMSLLILRTKAIFAWLAIALTVLGLWFASPKLQQHFLNAMPQEGSHTGTMEQRLDLWRAGIQMVKVKPLIGYGDAGYDVEYHKFKVAGAYGVAAKGSHMHNDLLNTWVLYGAVGLFIFILFFVFPLYDFIRLDKSLHNHQLWPWLITTVAGVWFMLFQGLSQCHFTDEEVQSLFWFMVAIFYGIKDQILNESQ